MKRIARALAIGTISVGIVAGATAPAQAWRGDDPLPPGPCQAMWWKNCEFL